MGGRERWGADLVFRSSTPLTFTRCRKRGPTVFPWRVSFRARRALRSVPVRLVVYQSTHALKLNAGRAAARIHIGPVSTVQQFKFTTL